MMKKMRGIFPALVTPFDERGRVNEAAIDRLVNFNINKGVDGFYVGGSTGESYLLSVEERKQALQAVMRAVSGRADVIANVGVFATEHGIELAKHAESLGVTAISSVPPFYFKFSMKEYEQYYKEIADSVSVPMIIYNVPALSGVNFSTEDMGRLFANDRIVGVKHTSYDLFQLQRVIQENPEKTVFIGHDEIFLSAYAAGARAAIGSTFNIMAEKFVLMARLMDEKRMDEALEVQGQVNAVVEVLCKVGVFKGIKAALKMLGLDCGVCRKPFLPLTEAEEAGLRTVLSENGVL